MSESSQQYFIRRINDSTFRGGMAGRLCSDIMSGGWDRASLVLLEWVMCYWYAHCKYGTTRDTLYGMAELSYSDIMPPQRDLASSSSLDDWGVCYSHHTRVCLANRVVPQEALQIDTPNLGIWYKQLKNTQYSYGYSVPVWSSTKVAIATRSERSAPLRVTWWNIFTAGADSMAFIYRCPFIVDNN